MPAAVQAAEVKAGDLVISQAWSRATPGRRQGRRRLSDHREQGHAPDRLIGGSADVAGKFEVHEMTMDEGVMTMRPLDKGLRDRARQDRQAGARRLSSDADGSEAPLKEGDKVPVTLQFEKAGTVQVSLDVQAVGAKAPARRRRHGPQGPFRHEDVSGGTMQMRACGRCRCRCEPRRSACGAASAHVTMQPNEAAAGGYVQRRSASLMAATAAPPRGRIKLPDGVLSVKPQMKPGWTVEIKKRKLEGRCPACTARPSPRPSTRWPGAAAACRTICTTLSGC